MKKLPQFIITGIFFFTVLLLLGATIKGDKENPLAFQGVEERNKKIGTPFESSGSTSRLALTEAIVESQTFFFDLQQARFAAPDFVEYQGKFFSIFTPGISFLGIPLYLLGKIYGAPQLFTYLTTTLAAFLNVFLVYQLSRKLGASYIAGFLSGFIFLFGSNALAYATTFTQHHVSTALVLLALLNAAYRPTFLRNIWLGTLLGLGILVDIPNLLLKLPVVVYTITQHFIIGKEQEKVSLILKPDFLGIVLGIMPFLMLFGAYNYQLTGSYTLIGQSIGRSDYFEPAEIREANRQAEEQQSIYDKKLPFDTRGQLQELYLLLISDERSWLYYSPVILFGFLGLWIGYRKFKQTFALVLLSTVLTNIMIYSLFGALGGWAFGPRYLIPAAGVLAASIGLLLTHLRLNLILNLLIFAVLIYSFGVSALGAITTTQIPPKIEAVNLPEPIPHTYTYNLQLLDQNMVGSLFYNLYLRQKISARSFFYGYFVALIATSLFLYLGFLFEKHEKTIYEQ